MKKVILFLLLILSVQLSAQRFEFGRVSDDEIKQTEHHLDSEASAAILYKKGEVSLLYEEGWKYVYNFEGRIKIYNTDGFDYATISVPLYRQGGGQSFIFSNFRGFTHNMEGGKSVKERVRNSNIFDEDLNEFWDIKKITFPNVKVGSVLEYTYTITSPYTIKLPEFVFQDLIPIDFAEYTMIIPEWRGYRVNSNLLIPVNRVERNERRPYRVTYTPRLQENSIYEVNLRAETVTFDVVFNRVIYSVNNVPRIIPEVNMGNYNNYVSRIMPELEWTNMPNSNLSFYSSSWDDVAKFVYRNYFNDELRSRNLFERELNALLANTNNNMEKASAIFEFVKSKMTWNTKMDYYPHSGVRKAFQDETGNVGDINLMLVAMMRQANIDASPVLVSTRSNGVPFHASHSGFNYVICGVKINSQIILFDATNKYSAPDVLPERALNWLGKIVKNENEIAFIELMPKTHSTYQVNMEVNINPDASLNGKYRVLKTQQHALRFRNSHATKSESIYVDELEKRLGDIEISEYQIQNKTDVYQPIIESFEFKKENAVDVIGGKIYISPLLFKTSTTHPYSAEKREYPIDYIFKQLSNYTVVINIPEGYRIDSMPQAEVFQLPDDIGEFRFLISQSNNTIQLRVVYRINQPVIDPQLYDIVKEYYTSIVSKQAEKIILSKI